MAFRISRIQTLRTASPTTVPGQTRSSKVSFVTSWPGRSTRQCSTAKALGVRRTSVVPRHSDALSGSRRNGGNRSDRDNPTSTASSTDRLSHLHDGSIPPWPSHRRPDRLSSRKPTTEGAADEEHWSPGGRPRGPARTSLFSGPRGGPERHGA